MAKKKTNAAAKKLQKKIGTGGVVLVALTFVIALALGAFVSYTMTKNDDFYLTTPEEQLLIAGVAYDYTTIRGDFYAVSMGKNVRGDVVVTPSFDVGEDGKVTFEPGVYYISYTLPMAFGTREVVKYTTITVMPTVDGSTSFVGGGANG